MFFVWVMLILICFAAAVVVLLKGAWVLTIVLVVIGMVLSVITMKYYPRKSENVMCGLDCVRTGCDFFN